ncbi:MAG TPA: S1/P1 nuclease, partial [Alphaproteobacteria bacterium]|nr:S1/P1 nuclease [Alphaproteobacteria bacterium]
FLVHFVGDIHQPMHAVGEARGGNDVKLPIFGSPQCGNYVCNLHWAWDGALIDHSGYSEEQYVQHVEELIRAKNLASRAGGTPAEWADESFRAAWKAWPPAGGSIDEAYYRANIGVVDERLALAGIRLAAMLNEALGTISPEQMKDDLARTSGGSARLR